MALCIKPSGLKDSLPSLSLYLFCIHGKSATPCKPSFFKTLISLILTEEMLKTEFDGEKLFQLMSSDKKREGDKLNFILLNEIGEPKIVSGLEKADILKAIKIS